MKKMIIVFFCMLIVSMNSFAEFVISPKLGYSNIFTLQPTKIEEAYTKSIILQMNSWNSFALGVDMGFIGKRGFTFLFDTNISLLGSITKKASFHSSHYNVAIDMKFKKIKGAYGNGELLFGYTFKQPNIYITLAGGLGAGGVWDMIPKEVEMAGKTINTHDLFKMRGFNVGFALHISVTYYFTKNIGLAFSLTDTPGFGTIFTTANEEKLGTLSATINDKYLSGSEGFSNTFYLKLGPVFKF